MELHYWYGVERPRGFRREMNFVAFVTEAARDAWTHAPKPAPYCQRFIERETWVRTALEKYGGGGNVYLGSDDERTEALRRFDCEQAIKHWEERCGAPLPEGAAPSPVRL